MKSKITFLFFLTLCLIAIQSRAQQAVYRVIVLNEGHYDYTNSIQTVPVTIGSYNPVTKVYQQFDMIDSARFATCVIVDDQSIYAAADSFIIRYDRDTHQRLAKIELRGVRKLALWNNQLLASRGEYGMTFNSYFEVYDKNSLAHIYSLPVSGGPQYACEGIVVKDDKAYVAINNGFEWGNEKGLIGIADLNAQSYLSEIDLGPMGKNPEYISLKDNEVFTVNNRDYSNASISAIDISSGTPTTYDLAITSGCGTSLLASTEIYYQPSPSNALSKFSTQTYSNVGTVPVNQSIYGMAYDSLNQLIYAGITDYTTTGKVIVYSLSGSAVDSFDVSVSPGNIAFDVREAASVAELNSVLNISIYPNPASENLSVFSNASGNLRYTISDVAGKIVRSGIISAEENILDIKSLAAGSYFIRMDNEMNSVSKLFIKL